MTDEKLDEKVDIKKSLERTLGCSGMQTQESIPDTIKIETGRIPNDIRCGRDYVEIGGIVSVISFSRAIKDWKEKYHKGLILKTTWFNTSYPAWKEWLENEQGIFLLDAGDFGELHEGFSSYTPQRLQRWLQEAINHHEENLTKIKDKYWRGGIIPKDFL